VRYNEEEHSGGHSGRHRRVEVAIVRHDRRIRRPQYQLEGGFITMDVWVNIGLDEIFGTSPQAAAYNGSKEKVETLLKAGADVKAQGGRSGTALQAGACDRSKKTDVPSLSSII
jgi:hypothetical protein